MQIVDMMLIMLECSDQIKLDALTSMRLVAAMVDHLPVICILSAIDEIGRSILLDTKIPIFLKPLNNLRIELITYEVFYKPSTLG